MICDSCKTEDCFEVVETPELVHWAKLVCSECGFFAKWLSDPKKRSYDQECEDLILEAQAYRPKSNFIESVISFYEVRKDYIKLHFAYMEFYHGTKKAIEKLEGKNDK